MSQSRGNSSSLAIIIVLIFSIVAIFIFQIGLQDREIIAPDIAKGADLAVIGGTSAALLAALEAAEHGAQVVLFPNGQELGEDTSFLVKGGLAAAPSPPQNELQIELTPERLAEKISEHGGAINDPLLLNAFMNTSSSLFSWVGEFEDFSFNFLPDPELRPYFHLASLHADLLFRKQLIERINKSPILVNDSRVEEILFSPNGVVQALLLEDDQSEKITYYFRAVILADGGYSGDIHYWQDFFPRENLLIMRPEQKGYGLRLAYGLGADVVQMGFLQKRALLYEPVSEQSALLPLLPWQDTYLVNTSGQILNWAESSPRDVLNLISQTLPGGAYILAPEERALSNLSFFKRFEELEDLLMAYPLEDVFRFSGLRIQAPYYIAPLIIGIEYSLGGVSVTPEGEVKKDGNVIKGLYAAGEIVGGLHGEALLPGMALSETFFTAKNAGKSAAKYSQH